MGVVWLSSSERNNSHMARVLKKPAVTSDVMLQTGTIIKYAKDTVKVSLLLFSAHISYGKGKYLNQTFFFLQNLPRIIVHVM